MASAYITTFEVVGKLTFPHDMLRYDCCFPADSDAVEKITIPHSDWRRAFAANERGVNVKLARIHSGKDPRLTLDRWRSFGWVVVEKSVWTRKVD